jgi:hypothetical protein
MDRVRLMWELVREDAVARALAIAAIGVAWFAATWLSLAVAALLPTFGAALWLRYRRVGETLGSDPDELL